MLKHAGHCKPLGVVFSGGTGNKQITVGFDKCPACFVSGSHECGNEIVYCTGSETYCFDFEGSLSKGGVSVKAAVKGCTSQSECNMSHDEKQELLRISVVFNRFECKLATPAASKASGWTLPPTLFLPIMAGLFLVKTMS
ncbi:phospholipase A2 inhibitor and Ly6/PLAUR domain-containing protein-like [Alligator mississippiensis]|uniref:Phospholipase A2 inhibitor and Ly6/PLAUR domain-containing protein-like n=1 Tax=Alligator mississippiensis TaxID=8496 RepID=A0A151MW93_ALLMI|nr:phospholipase A2 inhibitor and Ly6/PLAUR domain-containing protein-like [Alligator mississippiensis]